MSSGLNKAASFLLCLAFVLMEAVRLELVTCWFSETDGLLDGDDEWGSSLSWWRIAKWSLGDEFDFFTVVDTLSISFLVLLLAEAAAVAETLLRFEEASTWPHRLPQTSSAMSSLRTEGGSFVTVEEIFSSRSAATSSLFSPEGYCCRLPRRSSIKKELCRRFW